MALTSTALTTLAKAKHWLGLSDTTANAFKVYHDATGGATTATVAVSATTLTLTSSVGGQTQTLTLADAANDTLTELMAVVLPANGWVTTLLYPGDATSTELVPFTSTSCFGFAAEQTIAIMDNRGLELVIEGVSDAIEKWLGRGILTQAYTELVFSESGDDDMGLVCLAQPDVTAVEAVRLSTLHALTVTYTGSDVRATVEVTATSIITKSSGLTTTTLFTTSTTLAAVKTAVEAAAGGGWAVTIPGGISSSTASTLLARAPGRACKSVNVHVYAWEDYDGDYEVDYDPGVLRLHGVGTVWPYSSRDPWGGCSRQLQIVYTAGFATVPYDVELVALDMISVAWSNRGRDDRLQSESLEGYSYTYASAALAQSPEWQQKLARYQRVTP